MVRQWCVLYILTWKCASRHKRHAFFSSLIWPAGSVPAALASLLFDPPEPQIKISRLSYLFSHLYLLSIDPAVMGISTDPDPADASGCVELKESLLKLLLDSSNILIYSLNTGKGFCFKIAVLNLWNYLAVWLSREEKVWRPRLINSNGLRSEAWVRNRCGDLAQPTGGDKFARPPAKKEKKT